MSNLGEFFKIVAEQEKRKKAEAEMLDALTQHLSRISENTKVVDKVEEVETELSELETDLIADLICGSGKLHLIGFRSIRRPKTQFCFRRNPGQTGFIGCHKKFDFSFWNFDGHLRKNKEFR